MTRLVASIILTSVVISLSAAVRKPETTRCDVAVKFSSAGGTERAVIEEVAAARLSVLVAMYSFNNPVLTEALIGAARRDVPVSVKLDRTQSTGAKQAGQISKLKSSKVSVEVSREWRTMHHKFAVIDGSTVLTGSYNWTTRAEEKNAENLLIVKCRGVAIRYEKEWAEIR